MLGFNPNNKRQAHRGSMSLSTEIMSKNEFFSKGYQEGEKEGKEGEGGRKTSIIPSIYFSPKQVSEGTLMVT
jgi:hypothetical protein